MSNRTEYIDAADVAKLVRKALKSNFPGIKFSVRTSKYAGGASINVKWTDGPRQSDVEAVTRLYTGATFDGMRDLKEYHSSILTDEDGNVREVRFGADFIFCSRNHSAERVEKAVAKVEGDFGLDDGFFTVYTRDAGTASASSPDYNMDRRLAEALDVPA